MKSILDTNIWFLASAENLEESSIDKEAVKNHKDADKVRGEIFQTLMAGETIVPQRVVEELESLQFSDKTAKHNQKNIERLLYIFRPRAMEIIPTRQNILRQKSIVDALDITKETSQAFHTYQKLKEETLKKIKSGAEKAQESLDKQEPEAKWETIAREISALKDQRESTRDTEALNKKIKSKEKILERETPFLIPDYEILICSERTDAQITTLDNDLQVFWNISKSLRQIPMPKLAPFCSQMEKKFNQLEPKVREKTKDCGNEPSFG